METERRVAELEGFAASVPRVSAHLAALEEYCTAQSEAAVVADEWGRDVDSRVGELEQKVGNRAHPDLGDV